VIKVAATFVIIAALVGGSVSAADPEFSIEIIGLTDAEHTATDGTRVNYVYEVNDHYALGGAEIGGDYSTGGRSAWIYDGQTTTRIGFYDGIHVWNGFSQSSTTDLLSNGYVAGYSHQNGVANGKTAWIYDGNATVRVGIYDAAHTRDDGITNNFAASVNTSGQVVGYAIRYDYSARTAWFFDGTTTHTLGYTGGQYTHPDGGESSGADHVNEAGRVLGSSASYHANGGSLYSRGASQWVYASGVTTRIGLFDAEHTREANGLQRSRAQSGFVVSGENSFNTAGQVIGVSDRFDGDDVIAGLSAWIYDGTTTLRLGFIDAEHTDSRNDGQLSIGRALNEVGNVAGESTRYTAEGAQHGLSAWLYADSSTLNIGLLDADHSAAVSLPGAPAGYRRSEIRTINEVGQVVGVAARYALGDVGQSAWFYDGATTMRIGIDGADYTGGIFGFVERTATEVSILTDTGLIGGAAQVFAWTGPPNCEWGPCFAPLLRQIAWYYDGVNTIAFEGVGQGPLGQSRSEINLITDDGLVLGNYDAYDAGNFLGTIIFAYTSEWGRVDLDMLIDDSFDEQMWASLASVIAVDGTGAIYGNGILQDGSTMAYKLTPTPALCWMAARWGANAHQKRKAPYRVPPGCLKKKVIEK
jgi:hypothetical protein